MFLSIVEDVEPFLSYSVSKVLSIYAKYLRMEDHGKLFHKISTSLMEACFAKVRYDVNSDKVIKDNTVGWDGCANISTY